MPRAFDAKSTDPTVDAELDGLTKAPVVDLRKRYRELFRTDPPKAFSPDLLRRSVAHRLQENAYGGLTPPTQRLLDRFVKTTRSKPSTNLEIPRRIKPGSILVREWNGASYRVTVLADGFSYQGKHFDNLSEIATLITGTRWNGPRFFGLRKKAASVSSPVGKK